MVKSVMLTTAADVKKIIQLITALGWGLDRFASYKHWIDTASIPQSTEMTTKKAEISPLSYPLVI